MRGCDTEHRAFIPPSRKSREGVWCVSGRMGTPIHINIAVALSDLAIGTDRNQPLVMRISLLPDSVISRRPPEVRNRVSSALMLLYGLPRCRPRKRINPQRLIQGIPTVVHQAAGRRAESGILMPARVP